MLEGSYYTVAQRRDVADGGGSIWRVMRIDFYTFCEYFFYMEDFFLMEGCIGVSVSFCLSFCLSESYLLNV